jgi:hypothetical protein
MKLRPASCGSLANRLPETLPGPADDLSLREEAASVLAEESAMAGPGACREDEGWSGEREVEDFKSGLVHSCASSLLPMRRTR